MGMVKVSHVSMGRDVEVVYSDGTMSFFTPEELAEILLRARSEPFEIHLNAVQFAEVVTSASKQNVTIDSFIEDALVERMRHR